MKRAIDEELRFRLERALAECDRLRLENLQLRAEVARLKALSGPPDRAASSGSSLRELMGDFTSKSYTTSISKSNPSASHESAPVRHFTAEEKVAVFRNLFRGREDVYPVRWEGKNGKTGYSPVCRNEWNRDYCNKPSVKCTECDHRQFLPVTDKVIYDHLAGKHTIGVYPLLQDETCWFVAVDFDKTTWKEDVLAFLRTCDEMGVSAVLERSRSGNGGHVWVFFDQPVPARLARKLMSAVLTRTLERRHQVGFDSYDRLFPNQDTMPKGGFGNLIALPLQHGPRAKGNTVFLNRELEPHPDQWSFLATVQKMKLEAVEAVVDEAERAGVILGVRGIAEELDDDKDPWVISPSNKRPEKPITGPLPDRVRVVLSNLVYIEKQDLPPALYSRLLRLAAFQNPEFYKAQAMRLSTFGKPRIITCAEDFPRHIGLPRGCLEDALSLLAALNVDVQLTDQRFQGIHIELDFVGELRPSQNLAVKAAMSNDIGVLCAPPAFGKTVVAAWLIAKREVNTLILVHRQQLMDQWKERLSAFLNLPPESIGQIGGGRNRRSNIVDIALLQSLNRRGEIKDLVAEYGQVIIDECHHISAFSFEQVLKQVKARYVIGLTATPVRKDGHHPIIIMQCGPIRFRAEGPHEVEQRFFRHIVIPRKTEFSILGDTTIQGIYAALAADQRRNELILRDLLAVVKSGHSPLLLTERTDHLAYFADRLKPLCRNVVVLRGGMGSRFRKEVAAQLASIPADEERVLLGTGRYIGEGFDDPRLDTLFLALPISWRGTLQQYVGRLHRAYEGKRVVQIYDYVDAHVPMLERMYQKRIKGYKALGYTIRDGVADSSPSLFGMED